MSKSIDRLILTIGDAGGQKRIIMAKFNESEQGHVMDPIIASHQLFIENLAICISEPHQRGDQYATAILTERGRVLYEKLKTPQIYK